MVSARVFLTLLAAPAALLFAFGAVQIAQGTDKPADTAATPDTVKPAPLPPGIVARVGDTDITAEEVLARINEIERAKPNEPQHLNDAYTYLMNLAVLRGEAKRLGITVTPEEQKAEAERQIAAAKEKLKADTSGSVTWEQYARSQAFPSVESFEALFHERAPQILLKRRLIWLWEMTSPSVGFLQIAVSSREVGNKVLARVDAAKAQLDKDAKAGNPGEPPAEPKDPKADPKSDTAKPAATARWPEGSEFASGGMGDAFFRIAYTESLSKTVEDDAYDGQPIFAAIKKTLFEELKVGEYSGVVEVTKDRYAILYLKRKSPASKQTYEELKAKLDAMPDASVRQYERWLSMCTNTGRYQMRYRRPGDPEPAKPAPQAPPDDPAKPTEPAQPSAEPKPPSSKQE